MSSSTVDPANPSNYNPAVQDARLVSDIESATDTDSQVAPPIQIRKRPYTSLPTGLVYDVRMRFHAEPIQNVNDTHPEDPRRIFVVYDELRQAGLVFDPRFPHLAGPDLLKRIDARYATREEILRLHTREVWDFVMSLSTKTELELQAEGEVRDSVYLSVNTPMCALLAAGGAIEAARAVMNGQVKNSIAVIRPPGHHAEHHKVMGFCFFNNVPVAIRAIQKEFAEAARKILILDWDVHHGNGVQNMFYDDPNVLYISLHVDQGGLFYPQGEGQDHRHCGSDVAPGRNVNIPWSQTGMTDGDYLYAFQQVVMPIAQAFDPDLVFVCAGFDAAEGDPIGSCHVTPAGFAHMTHMLKSLADGKLVVCMEGGYNLRSVAVSALAVTRTLMGEQPARLVSTQASKPGAATVQKVLRQQAKYWPCLHMYDAEQNAASTGAVRMNEVIREWQAANLFDKHTMMPLFIASNNLTPHFDHQVLATPNFREKRPLLLIFHDPPDIIGGSYNKQGYLEPHNTWLADPVKSYIEWAIKHGFGVVDMNVPLPPTDPEHPYESLEDNQNKTRDRNAYSLALYVWENYIELAESTDIFVLGIGSAYEALVRLLKELESRVFQRLRKAFFFVCDNKLVSVRSSSETNAELIEWYFENATVFITQTHPAIADGQFAVAQNKRKRYGRCFASPERHMGQMLAHHREEICRVFDDETRDWRLAQPAGKLDAEIGEDVSMDGHD